MRDRNPLFLRGEASGFHRNGSYYCLDVVGWGVECVGGNAMCKFEVMCCCEFECFRFMWVRFFYVCHGVKCCFM